MKITKSDKAELLAQAIEVYTSVIESDDHDQRREFHRAVRDDALYTLAKCNGKPCSIQPTCHARRSAKSALREIYSELTILFFRPTISLTRARQRASAALGIEHRQFMRVLRSGGE